VCVTRLSRKRNDARAGDYVRHKSALGSSPREWHDSHMRRAALLLVVVGVTGTAAATAHAAAGSAAKFKFCTPLISGPSTSWSFSNGGKTVKFKGNKWVAGVSGNVTCSYVKNAASRLFAKWKTASPKGTWSFGKFTCVKTRVRSFDAKGFSSNGVGCGASGNGDYFSLTMIAPHTLAELGAFLKHP
jgi:hypothetical protein